MGAKPIIDRRRHRVYVTRNTEYHTRDNRCIAVRDRGSGDWLSEHKALLCRVLGSIAFRNGGVMPTPGIPQVGDSLYLYRGGGESLITSSLESVGRPDRGIVAAYAA
jgi:hypothetical protein